MIGLRNFAHRQLVVLVTTIVVLSSALDGCLLDCHTEQRAEDNHVSTPAHCHPGPSQHSGTRWQADPTCHHDHAVAAAEGTARNRLESHDLGVFESFALLPDRPLASLVPVIASTTNRSAPPDDFLPLRV
jgi:hypothetical protein